MEFNLIYVFFFLGDDICFVLFWYVIIVKFFINVLMKWRELRIYFEFNF